MSVININGLAPVKKLKRIKRWVGFWLLKDMPKAQITIKYGNFITEANTTAIEIKNANPFIEANITNCHFYPNDYQVVKKNPQKSLWQKIKDRASRRQQNECEKTLPKGNAKVNW